MKVSGVIMNQPMIGNPEANSSEIAPGTKIAIDICRFLLITIPRQQEAMMRRKIDQPIAHTNP